MRVYTIILLCGAVLFEAFGTAWAQGNGANPVSSPMTNALAADSTAEGADTNSSNVIPEIRFNNVPLADAIENLAMQAGINYQIDVRCKSEVENPASAITMDFKNVRAKELLAQLMDSHGFALVDDPVTAVAWVTKKGSTPKTVSYDLLAEGKKPSEAGNGNPLIPMISFSDVPMDVALDHLAKEIGTNVLVNSAVSDPDFKMLSVRWEHITAKQAIIAICENYDFSFMATNVPGVVVIVPAPKIK